MEGAAVALKTGAVLLEEKLLIRTVLLLLLRRRRRRLLWEEAVLELQRCFHVRAVKAAGGSPGCAPSAMRSVSDGEVLRSGGRAHLGSRRIQATRPIGRANQNKGHDVSAWAGSNNERVECGRTTAQCVLELGRAGGEKTSALMSPGFTRHSGTGVTQL